MKEASTVVETQTETAPSPHSQGCRCEAEIAEILARLDKIEREALTVEKLATVPRSRLIESLGKTPR
jgi:hypothetical protein